MFEFDFLENRSTKCETNLSYSFDLLSRERSTFVSSLFALDRTGETSNEIPELSKSPKTILCNSRYNDLIIDDFLITKILYVVIRVRSIDETYLSLSIMLRMLDGAQAMRYLTISLWPCLEAKWRAVCPVASIDKREYPFAWRSFTAWISPIFAAFKMPSLVFSNKPALKEWTSELRLKSLSRGLQRINVHPCYTFWFRVASSFFKYRVDVNIVRM